VPARELPPPRQRRRIWVAERTPWNEIAEAHAETGLDAADFKRQNPRYSRRRTVPARKFISIWAQSGVERRPETALDPNAPPVEANGDAVSIGRPQVGRIKHAEPLPPSSDYEIVFPDAIYGTSLTIATIQAAVTRFRDATGFEGSVRVGAISRRRGGKFPPHRSHQSGRDVDMPLLPMPYVTGNRPLRYDEVDWHATWALLAAFVETGRVQAVFVDERHHRRLRRAGLRMGATDAEIEAVMGMVMHAHGHGSHLHIRVQCSENAPRCKG
jgi:murein endopeptidase